MMFVKASIALALFASAAQALVAVGARDSSLVVRHHHHQLARAAEASTNSLKRRAARRKRCLDRNHNNNQLSSSVAPPASSSVSINDVPPENVAPAPPTTTSTPAAPPTQDAPAPPPTTTESSPPPSSGSFSGDGTFYDVGLGSCGNFNVETDPIVAISHELYDSFASGASVYNPNLNPVCGRRIRANYNGNSVVVIVQDRCGGCSGKGDLDFSRSAFNQLASFDVGRLHDVTWDFI